MSLRKAEFTITGAPAVAGVPGSAPKAYGSDDVAIRPSVPSRGAQAQMVVVDLTECTAGSPDVVIYELNDAALATGDSSVEEYEVGKQLFYADLKMPSSVNQNSTFDNKYEFDPRHPAVAVDGSAPTYDALTGLVMIHAGALRCEAYGLNPGDIVGVTLYYETAGDYRF